MMTARSIVQELIRYVDPPRGTAIVVNEAPSAKPDDPNWIEYLPSWTRCERRQQRITLTELDVLCRYKFDRATPIARQRYCRNCLAMAAAPKLRIKNLSTKAYHRFGSNQSTAMNKAAAIEPMIST
jgi:hypothetical protein